MPISENYTHRAEVRASLASNQEWIDEYFSKLLPMLTSQTNVGLISMENGSKPDVIYPEGQGKFFVYLKKNFVKFASQFKTCGIFSQNSLTRIP